MAFCEACQGTGEIVTDWERYLHALPGDVGDEAVADCPACDGTGEADEARANPDKGAASMRPNH